MPERTEGLAKDNLSTTRDQLVIDKNVHAADASRQPATPLTRTPALDRAKARSGRILEQLHDRGLSLEIVLGSRTICVRGDGAPDATQALQAAVRDLVAMADWLVARDGLSPLDMTSRRRYTTSTGWGFTVRYASLDEQVRAHVDRLRGGYATALRRAEADAIAQLLEALAQRAAQPCRGRAA